MASRHCRGAIYCAWFDSGSCHQHPEIIFLILSLEGSYAARFLQTFLSVLPYEITIPLLGLSLKIVF